MVDWSKRSLFYNINSYPSDKELSFCTPDEAINKVTEALLAIGITNFSPCSVHALEKTKTNNEDCYFVIMDGSMRNIPIIEEGFESMEAGALMRGSRMAAIVSAEGYSFCR